MLFRSVDVEGDTVLHGGNFHGDYVSFEMAKLKVTISVDVSVFMKPMISKPCKEGVEMFANLLSVFRYDTLCD